MAGGTLDPCKMMALQTRVLPRWELGKGGVEGQPQMKVLMAI